MKIKTIFLLFIIAIAQTFAAEINLSGTWLSPLIGEVELEQRGNHIFGAYQYQTDDGLVKDGEIDGLIIGNKIQARWLEYPTRGRGRVGEPIEGDLEWNITNDGKRLIGWYSQDGERDVDEEDKHEWNMER